MPSNHARSALRSVEVYAVRLADLASRLPEARAIPYTTCAGQPAGLDSGRAFAPSLNLQVEVYNSLLTLEKQCTRDLLRLAVFGEHCALTPHCGVEIQICNAQRWLPIRRRSLPLEQLRKLISLVLFQLSKTNNFVCGMFRWTHS